jgi:ribonuclease HI
MIVVYTDGGCNRIKRIASWAFVAYDEGNRIAKDSGILDNSDAQQFWNIAGELKAVLEAVAWMNLNNYKEFELCFDYSGIEHWALYTWKRNNYLTQYYADFMQSQFENGLIIHFKRVKGHTGVFGNEEVDKLCQKEMKNYGEKD